MIAVVYSEKDRAGTAIARALKDRKCPYPIIGVPQDIIYAEGIDAIGAELVVMASRHEAKSGKPSLTVHSAGNFGKAEHGGVDRTLQNTLANAKHNIYLELRDCPLDYAVTLEATHHGPTGFRTPLVFVEIGSSEEQWRDDEAVGFVADCILKGLVTKKKRRVAIGFGGGHYCPKFSEMEDIAFGHIAAKYACDFLDEGLIAQMINKTLDGIDTAVLDEKGLNKKQKSVIKSALETLGVEY